VRLQTVGQHFEGRALTSERLHTEAGTGSSDRVAGRRARVDIQFHAESASVPPAERESQSEGDRPSGSASSRPPLPVPSSRGHLSRGSSTSSRGRLTPV
jgi:hypothetical protein